jgi:hypothetical protein
MLKYTRKCSSSSGNYTACPFRFTPRRPRPALVGEAKVDGHQRYDRRADRSRGGVAHANDDPVGHLAERDDAAAFLAITRAARLVLRSGVTSRHIDRADRSEALLGFVFGALPPPTR